MNDAKTPVQRNTQIHIPTPNLQILLHYYSRVEYLFQTISMYAADEREQVFDQIVNTKTWYWGRYAPGHRQIYMAKRLFVEARLYNEFSRKYWRPKTPYPIFFYLLPMLSLPVIEEQIAHRQLRDEPNTCYLLLNLRDLSDLTHVSFTLGDSHQSYREALRQHGFPVNESPATCVDHGHVFHVDELPEVYLRNATEDGLCFEVQVWDPEILEHWKAQESLA
jgi:hypothetical protein